MSDTFGKANRATPAATLEQKILDPNHPKNDREWWAADEITRLRAEVEKLNAHIVTQRGQIDKLIMESVALTARVKELEVEVEAAKKFGGGFYGEAVEEGTREVYRGFARAALSASQEAPAP